MKNESLQIIFGGGNIGDKDTSNNVKINTLDQLQPLLDVFRAHGHGTIDTSRHYPNANPGGSEALLGASDLTWTNIDTKVTSTPGAHAPDKIAESITASLAALKIPQFNTIYLHFPDRTVPLITVVPAIASAVQCGQARRWAISNYSAAEVDTIISICQTHSLPPPHSYQGHYNALTRHAETDLLPTLRRHNIAFYAYSPAAGGAFSPSGSSRMQQTDQVGAVTRAFYGKSAQQAAITHVHELAAKYSITSGHELALRWVAHHSALSPEHGDAMVVAASSAAQLEGTLTGLERGPLPGEVVQAMERAWETAKETAPAYSPFLEDLKWQ